MAYKHFRITIKVALICIVALMILSCGGGGGGGMVSFQDNPGIHNNGDAGGFGTGNQTGNGFNPQGQNIEDAEAGPLISQMAALDVTTVDIRLTVNNDEQPLIVADATTTTAVLPKIKPGYIVSGTATIHLADGTARTAVLDETEATLHGTLKFKVPYNYTANDLSGTQVASGTYFARDGINLAAQTVDPIAGWQCAEDGSIHYGGYVAGVRGDITLNAVLGDGAPALTATASQNVLYATATSFDTTMITITNVTGTPRVSDISSQLIASVPVADNPLNPTSYTLTIGFASGSVWFDDDTAANVTITDDSGATTSVPLTLKNKYSYVLLNHAGEGGTITRGPENAGYELTFANAKSIASAYSTSVPAGQEIIAFQNISGGGVYNETDFPITFNSTNLNSRSVTLQAVLDFAISAKDAVGNTWSGATEQTNSGKTGMLYTLEKYSNTTKELKICLSGYSDLANLSASPTSTATYLDIGTINSSGEFTVKLKDNVTHDSISSSGYTYTIAITDNGTNTTKYIHVKVARPGEYKYSLVYQRGSGANVTYVQIPGWQNIDFTPGSSLRFGIAEGVSTLKMGDLDSSLTGLEAAMSITGWKSTRASNPPTYNTPFPNVGAADCESDNTITLIATTDFGSLLDAYRQSENDVQTGNIVLSNGITITQSFYNNHKTLLSPYLVGVVFKDSSNQKWVLAKSYTNSKNWSSSASNQSSLTVNVVSGTQASGHTASDPRYDLNSSITLSNNNSGKAAGITSSSFPAFQYCANYGASLTLEAGSPYATGWYLPSVAEAIQMYKNRSSIPSGFTPNQPWMMTSSQFNQDKFWYLAFDTAILKTYNKTSMGNRWEVYPCHEFTFVAP